MIPPGDDFPQMRELRQAIARIALLSQIPAAKVGQGARDTDDDIGGRRPSGGIDRKDDRETDFPLRSVDYFNRRLKRCHTERAVTELLAEANRTLEAWKRTPIPEGQPPEYGSPQWKRWIADSDLPATDLAHIFGISRQYVHQIRKAYRQAA